MKEFLYKKMDDIYFDQLIKSYRLPRKKKIISVFVQKLLFFFFFAVGQLLNVTT